MKSYPKGVHSICRKAGNPVEWKGDSTYWNMQYIILSITLLLMSTMTNTGNDKIATADVKHQQSTDSCEKVHQIKDDGFIIPVVNSRTFLLLVD